MDKIGIDHAEVVVAPAVGHGADQVLAHAHQRGRSARREVEAANQFLAARLGRLVQRERVRRVRIFTIARDRVVQPLAVGAEAAGA